MAKRITKKNSSGAKLKRSKRGKTVKSAVKVKTSRTGGSRKSVSAKKTRKVAAKKVVGKITANKILKTAGKKTSANPPARHGGIENLVLPPLGEPPWPPVVDTD